MLLKLAANQAAKQTTGITTKHFKEHRVHVLLIILIVLLVQ